jgi:menaquinone-dependent protoporphyrinogen IX oxidase
MERIVLFKSVFGATREYAKKLSTTLGSDLDSFDIADEKLKGYDLIVVMSGTYAGKMPLVSFLVKNWELLKGKKVVAVSVGLVPADSPKDKLAYETITREIRAGIRYFKIPGKFGINTRKFNMDNLKPILEYISNLS